MKQLSQDEFDALGDGPHDASRIVIKPDWVELPYADDEIAGTCIDTSKIQIPADFEGDG